MIREAIIQAMRDKGISQRQLAKLAGVSQQSVHRFLRGDPSVLPSLPDRLVKVLGTVKIKPGEPS